MLKLSRAWMGLAVLSLALAGILSILLVLLRTPGVEALLPYHNFFRTALVAHVDLSVLVWMLSIGGLLWSMVTDPAYYGASFTAVILMLCGSLLIVLTPFTGESFPLMNNYIPVLQRFPFFLGLGCIACATLFQAGACVLSHNYITASIGHRQRPPAIETGIYLTAVITLIALLCFVIAYQQLDRLPIPNILHFYEQLFWGGGHVLQFTYTQLMLIIWLALATAAGVTISLSERWIYFLLSLNITIVLPSPVIYFFHAVDTPGHTRFFTEQMRYMGGTAAAIIGVVMVVDIFRQRAKLYYSPAVVALLCSLALFGAGGILGHLISGANVTVPAHYHGSIVGITLAFMGFIYHSAPQLGLKPITGKLAFIQPLVYGGGQFLHIAGLAWSGGYGALRKTPGVPLSPDAVAGMALMGTGGLIAIIGGILFVIVVVNAWIAREN